MSSNLKIMKKVVYGFILVCNKITNLAMSSLWAVVSKFLNTKLNIWRAEIYCYAWCELWWTEGHDCLNAFILPMESLVLLVFDSSPMTFQNILNHIFIMFWTGFWSLKGDFLILISCSDPVLHDNYSQSIFHQDKLEKCDFDLLGLDYLGILFSSKKFRWIQPK